MGKYLVVANQTLGGEQLMGEVRQRMDLSHGAERRFNLPVTTVIASS